MTSELATFLNDVNIPLVQRVNRVDQLYEICDQCNRNLTQLQTTRTDKGITDDTRDALVGVLGRPRKRTSLDCAFRSADLFPR